MTSDSRGDTSLARALRVLIALGGTDGLPVSVIADRLDMPVSTVYRFLRELRRFGLVMENGEGTYAIGPVTLHLALGGALHSFIVESVEPVLYRLVNETRETSMATVRSGLYALTLAQVESPNPIRLSFRIGHLRPLHAGASATALLAFESPSLVEQAIRRGLERFTDQTPVTAADLRQRLAKIRERGYAISEGEVDEDAIAVAAPVFYRDRIVCAISVAGPANRIRHRVDEIASLLTALCESLSRDFPETRLSVSSD